MSDNPKTLVRREDYVTALVNAYLLAEEDSLDERELLRVLKRACRARGWDSEDVVAEHIARLGPIERI